MFDFERIAERRIAEAVARGDFDNLAGKGKPLELDDDRWVPPDQRLAFRVLKNAGFAPQEVRIRREIAEAEEVLASNDEKALGAQSVRRLNLLFAQLDVQRRLR